MAAQVWWPRSLYYITHIQNLPSILEHGILSHAEVERCGIEPATAYDTDIVDWRKTRLTPAEKSLWHYANLYLQPRNPMLYRVLREQKEEGDSAVVILEVAPRVMRSPEVFFTTGNAARLESQILPIREWPRYAQELRAMTQREWWSEVDGSKRGIMAEVLVPQQISPQHITAIHVPDLATRERVQRLLPAGKQNLSVIPSPAFFFLPQWVRALTSRLRLIEGDLFFSQRQTLPISVNTVCVMGKGLASRVRYQFPDAYVAYQDACRQKALAPGKPYLYKRETPVDLLFADEIPFRRANRTSWFLFFPTKRHWRQRSRLDDIENGLRWLVKHYPRLGIQSLAMPALGCGLGGLRWAQVGPLMMHYLSQLEIPVDIHLPLEQRVPDEQRTPEFLLSQPRLL